MSEIRLEDENRGADMSSFVEWANWLERLILASKRSH